MEQTGLPDSVDQEQVRHSPVVDSAEPVSRQQEIAMTEYFGRLACWVDRQAGAASIPTGTEYPPHSKGNPHLRSVWHLVDEFWSVGAEDLAAWKVLLWMNLLGISVTSTQKPGIGLPATLC